jgi:16S rRNA (guanine(966)-N(2))-methyltransferase RsmD
MRVISGSAKGRRLAAVPGDSTRPITDRVKESLFNIIGPEVQHSTFLDLFAGTGSVGIEALSRGAEAALFIDLNRRAVKTIHSNLKLTQLAERAQVMKGNAYSFLEGPANRQFDYIYIAPPQYQGLWLKALELLDSHLDWLSADGWVIVQIHPSELIEFNLKHLVEFDRRSYGSTVLLFLQGESS